MLPEEMIDCGESWDLDGVIAHELAHIKRHDWEWNLLFQTIEILFWFHPLVWRLRQSHMHACENACDDLAAEVTGDRMAYKQTLARVALATVNRQSIGMAMARNSEIMTRLRRLEKPNVQSSLKTIAIVMTVLPLISLAAGTLGFVSKAEPEFNAVIAEPDDQETNTNDPNTFLIKIFGADASKATVEVRYFVGEKETNLKLKPNENGIVKHKLGDEPLSHVLIVCRTPGRVPFALEADGRNRRIDLSDLVEANLGDGYEIRGSVKDFDGKPVPGARIQLSMSAQRADNPGYPFDLAELETNDKGQWKFPNAPWELKANRIRATVNHDDYMPATSSLPSYPLEDAVFETTLQRGVTWTGKIVDENGDAIENASVTLGPMSAIGVPKSLTNSSGEYSLKNCRRGNNYLVVVAAGYAPELVDVIVDGKRESKKDITLSKGKTLTATVVDQFGKPVVNAYVGVQTWRKDNSLAFKTRTDAKGVFTWKDAPADPVWFTFFGDNHRLIVHHELFPETPDQKVTLYTRQTVKLKIVDDENGELIGQSYIKQGLKFKGIEKPAWRGNWIPVSDGEVEYRFKRHVEECWLRVWAQGGYQSQVLKFKLGDPDIEKTVRLKPIAGESEMAWESVKIAIESGQIPMSITASAYELRDNNAVVKLEESGLWSLTIRDKWTIASAMFGVANISTVANRDTWKGEVEELLTARDLPRLKLKLEGFMVTDQLLEVIGQLKNLEILDLDDCPLGELVSEDWSDLGKASNLRELYLDGHWQEFPPAAAEALTRLGKLEKLIFDGTGAYLMDSTTFDGRLSKMQSLKVLRLNSHSGFDNRIGEEVAQLKGLKSVGVQGKQINDEFVKTISHLDLKELSFHLNSVTDNGLRLAAESFPTLESLDIVRTKITAEGVRDVATKFPRLRRLNTEEYDHTTLVDFKRLHPDCVVIPTGFINAGTVGLPAIELPKSEAGDQKGDKK